MLIRLYKVKLGILCRALLFTLCRNISVIVDQHGQNDQFYYGYKYDDENRLTESWSSATQANVVPYGIGSKLDFATKKQDAGYSYYLHGPLARMELAAYGMAWQAGGETGNSTHQAILMAMTT
jgi:hypothetical protein